MNPIAEFKPSVPRPSRREFLRGAGVVIALPWLESRQDPGAASRPVAAPVRMAFLYMPNGVLPSAWVPKTEGQTWKLSETLAPLEFCKSKINVFGGLCNANSRDGDGHYAKSAPFLTGCKIKRTGGRDIHNGISVDQFAALHSGGATALPSMELGTDTLWLAEDMGYTTLYGAHISWRSAQQPAPKEIIPQLAFDRMFRDWRARNSKSERSVLDAVLNEARALQGNSSAADKRKIDEYMESVRALELRMERAASSPARIPLQGATTRPAHGVPKDFDTHVELLMDLMALAFQTDNTRIISFMMSHEVSGRDFSFLDGVTGSFHELSHHEHEPGKKRQYALINRYYVSKYASLLKRLDAMDEGGRSVLDNSMILFGSGIRDGNAHDPSDLPIVVAGGAGGRWKTGRMLQYPKGTKLCSLYISMLQHFGAATPAFGDATGPLAM